MSPLTLMQRLAALAPRPRLHLIRLHSVLAANAKLLRRVFEIDMAHGPNRGGELKIIAPIMEQPVIEKVLMHLGFDAALGAGQAVWQMPSAVAQSALHPASSGGV